MQRYLEDTSYKGRETSETISFTTKLPRKLAGTSHLFWVQLPDAASSRDGRHWPLPDPTVKFLMALNNLWLSHANGAHRFSRYTIEHIYDGDGMGRACILYKA
ncbi:hypothetical protein AAG570_009351 [Ranatra chinensis]|uniref:Uncharacterized protein n=1 Tax=Ranatra chinensis TaxID=642074 RepID=A0ABD0YNU9_9HEMI